MFQEISESMLSDRIYVFTPKGDVETLVAGSTPVDFAYSVHSSVGDSCVGARVNGTIKPLDYQLKSREIVEILTKKGRTPNPAWLDFVKSSKAKERIKTFVNKHRETLIIGKGDDKTVPERTPKPIAVKKSVRRVGQPQQILIGGERNIPFRIPSCCKPRPGQSVVAYKSRGLFFTIHKPNCPQCKRLDPDRFFEAYFITTKKIEMSAIDRFGFSRDCTAVIASHGLNIGELTSRHSIDKENRKIVTWKCSLEVRSTEEFQKAMKDLQNVKNMLSVKERR
jgi:(p)ppGpp synthase/HD superfamily hydrolase